NTSVRGTPALRHSRHFSTALRHSDGTSKALPRRRPKMAEEVTLSIYRGTRESGAMVDYTVPRQPGMVVLDAVHSVQALHAPDLACRWNCKAGKCGSCSGEVNGKPRLMCMDRLDKYPRGEPSTVRPMTTFPVI